MQTETEKEPAGGLEAGAQSDEAAVAAVRKGDAERYRELVERHERRVYAVAWSRLGDPALAEEVTQESFIRAYRHLWLLGNGAKFAGWISTIARRVAINFGLRHRREMNKRERWALERATSATPDGKGLWEEDQPTPETIRECLAQIPAAYRECLVLFYLEGKSGAEAAAALGLTESAFRVRLHRARAALREHLEKRMESSLAKLRPARPLAPAIMAAVLAGSSAKAATAGSVGSAVLVTLGKVLPLKWVATLFPVLFALPMFFFSWLSYRAELSNFRDKQGFRAKLLKKNMRQGSFRMILIMAVMMWLIRSVNMARPSLFLMIGGASLLATAGMWRQSMINRSRYFLLITLSSTLITVASVAVGLELAPISAFNICLVAQLILATIAYGQRPFRLDYSLFLRAAQGLLKPDSTTTVLDGNHSVCGWNDLLTFARFLGSRWMVDNHQWKPEGLLLRLSAVSFVPWHRIWFFNASSERSTLLLRFEGRVSAHISQRDLEAIQDLNPGNTFDRATLENSVTEAVLQAWSRVRADQQAEAETLLGQLPEEEVVLKSPRTVGAGKWRLPFVALLLGLWVVLLGGKYIHPAWLSGQKEVTASEAEVRAFLGNLAAKEPEGKFNGVAMALFSCLTIPSTNLFTPDSIRTQRDELARQGGQSGFEALRQNPSRTGIAASSPTLRNALASRWLHWSDLNLRPEEAAAAIRTSQPFGQQGGAEFLFTQCQAWSWVSQNRYKAARMQLDGLNHLRFFQSIGCLELLDRKNLIRQIASAQILSGTPPGQPPMHDWTDIKGLFFVPCFPALQDTYYALAALEILGGLGVVDREACIEGILRRHQGRGFFDSPSSGGYNEYHIDGGCRDTFAAFESLRILGALDRVKDLSKWTFRVNERDISKPDATGVRNMSWAEVEAWICQQRLNRILNERMRHPASETASLSEPREP